MNTTALSHPLRFHRFVVGATVLVGLLGLAGCSSSSAPDLESIGLRIEADIQAGASFELAFPSQDGTTMTIVSAPPGVDARIGAGSEPGTNLLTVVVDGDTPRGAYNLAITVVRDGEETNLGWPFEVVEP